MGQAIGSGQGWSCDSRAPRPFSDARDAKLFAHPRREVGLCARLELISIHEVIQHAGLAAWVPDQLAALSAWPTETAEEVFEH